jgi:asparagine synthase (glutamine-hydrolysing)
MCGLAGFVDFNKRSLKTQLEKMTDVLMHRGPDDSGYKLFETKEAIIGLGHRRLSILDLSMHGHQPMDFENFTIVYNGEIYNFREIRVELEKYNYIFHSDSDTEVILKAFHKWGIKCIDKFNGMFLIVIFNKEKNHLTLIRDRAGVKPCFYYHKDNLFLFSSELKSFHKHPGFEKNINFDSLGSYLQYGYISEPNSIFENTYKLESGYYLEIDLKSKKISKNKYWNVIEFYDKPKLKIAEEEALEELERLLISSFEYRMVSDVPVGVFLSGGYDSSIVTAILQSGRTEKINTFTIGFKEKGFDEAPHAKKIAKFLGTNHTEYYCTQKDALEILPKLCDIFDEPFGDNSSIPTILVSQLARKDVTVSLSADGGDEIFAGYSKYDLCLNYLNKFDKIPSVIRSGLSSAMSSFNPKQIPYFNNTYNFETKYLKAMNALLAKNSVEMLKLTSQHFTKSQINNLLKPQIKTLKSNFDLIISDGNDFLNKMLAIDYKTYMVDDVLTKVDRSTMSVGLEGREPLLDYRIIEFAAQLPSELKYKNGIKKSLLKQITHKYLPKELMDRPKMGFGVPITEWFKNDLKEYFMTYLSKERLEKEGIFNVEEVLLMRNRFLEGDNESARRLWFILIFELWHEKWMTNA